MGTSIGTGQTSRTARLESILDAFVRGEIGKKDLKRIAMEYDLGVSPERLVAIGLRRRRRRLFAAVTGRNGA